MASPADAVAYAAQGNWDQETTEQVAYWLQTGHEPDGLSEQARQAINDLAPMGLSSTGVNQLVSYLQTGQAPADLSYADESAQVLGGAPDEGSTGVAQAPATPAATSGGLTTAQQSARAVLDGVLDSFGLGGLGDSLWQQYLGGAPIESIMQNLRKTPEYAARFPGMARLAGSGHAISEQQYIDLESSYTQIFRAAGLPTGFYDSPDDFATLIGGQVAPTEVKQRVDLAVQAAAAPNETHDELARLYGVDTGQLAAFYLDPDKALPLLTQQYQAASVAGVADRTGFGGLQRGEAERIAALGVSDQQAQQGFTQLAQSNELFRPLDSGEQQIGRDVQLGAAFEGNAAAQRAVDERERRRKAEFAAGGSYAATQQGVTGLGSAAS